MGDPQGQVRATSHPLNLIKVCTITYTTWPRKIEYQNVESETTLGRAKWCLEGGTAFHAKIPMSATGLWCKCIRINIMSHSKLTDSVDRPMYHIYCSLIIVSKVHMAGFPTACIHVYFFLPTCSLNLPTPIRRTSHSSNLYMYVQSNSERLWKVVLLHAAYVPGA